MARQTGGDKASPLKGGEKRKRGVLTYSRRRQADTPDPVEEVTNFLTTYEAKARSVLKKSGVSHPEAWKRWAHYPEKESSQAALILTYAQRCRRAIERKDVYRVAYHSHRLGVAMIIGEFNFQWGDLASRALKQKMAQRKAAAKSTKERQKKLAPEHEAQDAMWDKIKQTNPNLPPTRIAMRVAERLELPEHKWRAIYNRNKDRG